MLQNLLLNLKSQRLFCSPKAGVKYLIYIKLSGVQIISKTFDYLSVCK